MEWSLHSVKKPILLSNIILGYRVRDAQILPVRRHRQRSLQEYKYYRPDITIFADIKLEHYYQFDFQWFRCERGKGGKQSRLRKTKGGRRAENRGMSGQIYINKPIGPGCSPLGSPWRFSSPRNLREHVKKIWLLSSKTRGQGRVREAVKKFFF